MTQALRQGLSARIKFANANIIWFFSSCFRNSRYKIVKFPAELRPLLSVPEDEEIVMGIALGYAAEDSINEFVSARLPLEEILTIKK